MKILSSKVIRGVDIKTIEYNNMLSHQLMEWAASAFSDYFINNYSINSENNVVLFCGTGNNGGDGVAIARILHHVGFSVKVFIVESRNNYSDDCLLNIERANMADIDITTITSIKQFPDLKGVHVIVDAIFGTGLSRALDGLAKDVVEAINAWGKKVVSVDIPSGLFMDGPTTIAVKATETVTFQVPKLSLFLPENDQFIGHLTIIDIGLDKRAIAEAETDSYYLTKKEMASLLKPLSKFTHKGIQGHALIIGGSLGKIGAVSLASKAALKSGCGLVTVYVPQCGMDIIQSSFPEAMVIQDNKGEFYLSSISYTIKPSAIALGMGMGHHEETKQALYTFLQTNKFPLVIDADALNILSENNDWLKYLISDTILTPHPGELSRLIGSWDDDFEKIERTKEFARKYDVMVVIKGAHSVIIDSNSVYVNSSGTPALATAGSGDVLAGIIAGLLAQGFEPLAATQLGVYVHGMTANITLGDINSRAFIASDIIENIGKVYNSLSITDDIDGYFL